MKIIPLVVLLTGCATTCPVVEPVRIMQPVEVRVPVPSSRRAPPELLEPLQPLQVELPAFVSPAAHAASSALTAEGEQRLKALLVLLRARIAAWEAWAVEPGEPAARDAVTP